MAARCFLDEIAELSPGLQAKLLRFLHDKQFERLGENQTRRADVRVVAATNRNLEDDVASGRFRTDLLYRLNVVVVQLPALRERREDILPLARGFLDFFARQSKRPPAQLSAGAEKLLTTAEWPGNIRELRNAVERAAHPLARAGAGRGCLWRRGEARVHEPPGGRGCDPRRSSSGSTSSGSWRGCPATRKPPASWGSTRRPSTGSASATKRSLEAAAGG